MKKEIILANGEVYELPQNNLLVTNHFNSSHSYINSLLRQINEEKIYAKFFVGKKDLVFLDLGANIGLVSIYAKDSCSRIVSVEPSIDTFNVLKALTEDFKNIEIVRAAISPENGEVKFFLNDINSTASSTVNTYGTETSVLGLRLSTLLRQKDLLQIDICKIDIEGAEGDSLSFDELYFAKDIIDCYYIEVHNCPKTTWQYKMNVIVENLSKVGYNNIDIIGDSILAKKI